MHSNALTQLLTKMYMEARFGIPAGPGTNLLATGLFHAGQTASGKGFPIANVSKNHHVALCSLGRAYLLISSRRMIVIL
jgi:hypothetical protein